MGIIWINYRKKKENNKDVSKVTVCDDKW